METKNAAGWFHAALKMANELQRAEYERANKKPDGTYYKNHRSYPPNESAIALSNAAHAGDEVETKRLMHVIRCGALTLV